ncbi:hypothetical protein [Methanobrevibacter sp.]|uniref:hypothetical protein n=1 Tax=Methanobrevibacter sp. TaxID=66852 RepID=UPI00389049C8
MILELLDEFMICLCLNSLEVLEDKLKVYPFSLPMLLFKTDFDEKMINEKLTSFNNILLFDIINGKENYLDEFLELCDFSNENVFKFIISELIDNIFDHAHSKNAYVIAYCKKDHFDVIIFDDGITIPYSLESHDFIFKKDWNAILNAIGGISTKNEFGYYERGCGLNNCFSLMTQGGCNSILVASGKGIICSKKDKLYKIDISNKAIDGTIIGLRFDLNYNFNSLYEIIKKRYDVEKMGGVNYDN